MKNKIVLVPFPFDDLSATKVRPAVCLTHEIEPYAHVVLAFITSQVYSKPTDTDLIINAEDAGFLTTGLKVSSTIRLHRMITVSKSIISRQLGELTNSQQGEVEVRLRKLFEL